MDLTLEESNWILMAISDEIREIRDLTYTENYKKLLIKLKEKVKKERLKEINGGKG